MKNKVEANLEELKLFIDRPYKDLLVFIERKNLTTRVVKNNGRYYICTKDYKLNRINVELVNKIIKRIYLG